MFNINDPFIMKILSFLVIFSMVSVNLTTFAQEKSIWDAPDHRVDNNGYWKEMARKGLATLNPVVQVAPATFTGSDIRAAGVLTENSPDIVVITGATSQSENSIFVDPNNSEVALNSNNSTNTPGGGTSVYGADYLYTDDFGLTWDGSIQGAGGSNSGDPAAVISKSGRYLIGYIASNSGQGVSYSDDGGVTWTKVQVANASGYMNDKNHLWIDNSSSSPYQGYAYSAWTAFGGSNNNNIEICISTDEGESWSSPKNISSAVNAGSHCQGVNIQTGPNGEVYACYSIYDGGGDENAIGFSKSYDGGQTWEVYRIIENIRGVRGSTTSKNMRVNSFPAMTVDLSNSSFKGNIYIVWTNIGVPGINQGSDRDVYLIRSEDEGETWSEPIRVNQDAMGTGKQHFEAWVTCDPVSGTLSAIWMDDRNVGSAQCEVFCGNSYDGGDSWEDFKVSDVSFTPSPIPGLASGYFGDYLGISAYGGRVYPCWTDNRTGTALTYVSPYMTSTMTPPTNLAAELDEETGEVSLTWEHPLGPTFDHFNIYRDLQLIGTTTFPVFTDTLPGYGIYRYMVTAFYSIEGESGGALEVVQWGSAQISLDPTEIETYVIPGGISTEIMTISNPGELELNYSATLDAPPAERETRSYCNGIGGCGEFIANVRLKNIDNYSGCNGYEDFTDLSATVVTGITYQVIITNGSLTHPEDLCGVWIDWNQNTNFNDDEPIIVAGFPGVGPYTANITPPDGAKTGVTRMRIRIVRGGTLAPCGLTATGEVEDYSLNVIGWIKASPLQGSVAVGESGQMQFNFNATGLANGTYEALMTIQSNDIENPVKNVPVTMNVTDAAVAVTADKDSICFGSDTRVYATVTGGSGNVTYNWTSDPPGFTSTEQNPIVDPEETTRYFVEVVDGGIVLNDDILITVVPLPEPDLGPDIAFCSGETAVLTPGSDFASYLWSNGSNDQSTQVSQAGTYWVDVTNAFGCSKRDSVTVTVNPLPEVMLGDDRHFCEGTTVTIEATAGFTQYEWNTGATGTSITVAEPGVYWVLVTDENGCMDTDSVELFMDPLPGETQVLNGDVSVDTYLASSSQYSCEVASYADNYSWALEPAIAGTLEQNGTTATVSWDAAFTGTASLTVRSVNECGQGESSPSYLVNVYTTLGVDESGITNTLNIFPNPTQGTFRIEFQSSQEITVEIKISSTTGELIFGKEVKVQQGPFSEEISLNGQPFGIYNLTLKEGNKSITKKVVYKK